MRKYNFYPNHPNILYTHEKTAGDFHRFGAAVTVRSNYVDRVRPTIFVRETYANIQTIALHSDTRVCSALLAYRYIYIYSNPMLYSVLLSYYKQCMYTSRTWINL